MKKLILQKIESAPGGMISFADFIETVLYHPDFGYYMREGEKIGRSGDFITSSSISGIYGNTIAKWFLRIVKEQKVPPVFCEIGAGNGRFAKAFLEEWSKQQDTKITYYIIETSPYHRKLQSELLSDYNVSHVSLENLPPIKGVVFSNELFDALPVHVVKKQDGCLRELMVTMKNGELAETTIPLENEEICRYIKEHNMSLAEGQQIEIPLEMEKMLSDISNILSQWLVVTVDYGYTEDEWQEPARKSGSLRGYYKHKMITNILEHPGDMDITSHIHLDGLISIGEKAGLSFLGMWKQDEFLLKAGILEELANNFDPNPFSETSKKNRAIRSLVMPGGISSAFHVIIQQRNVEMEENSLWAQDPFN